MNIRQIFQLCCLLVLSLVVTHARSVRHRGDLDSVAEESRFGPYVAVERQDQDTAATGHHHGRVQIKVYRGPDQHGHDHEHFAPHGYWVKQPADDDHHH